MSVVLKQRPLAGRSGLICLNIMAPSWYRLGSGSSTKGLSAVYWEEAMASGAALWIWEMFFLDLSLELYRTGPDERERERVSERERERERVIFVQCPVQNYGNEYSSSPLIRPPYLPLCRGSVWWEGELNTFIVGAARICGHIREGGLCWEWLLRGGPVTHAHTCIIVYFTFWWKTLPNVSERFQKYTETKTGWLDHVDTVVRNNEGNSYTHIA